MVYPMHDIVCPVHGVMEDREEASITHEPSRAFMQDTARICAPPSHAAEQAPQSDTAQ